jgi:hypothetical protein
MITFDITSCIDKFYPYRTALLEASIWITLDDKEKQRISKYLQLMGYKMDNHICWKNRDGMCFCYSDNQLGLGLEIREENY